MKYMSVIFFRIDDVFLPLQLYFVVVGVVGVVVFVVAVVCALLKMMINKLMMR